MSTPTVNLNKQIIALFSGQTSTFTTPKLYVQVTGSQSLGLILNQIVFYSNKSTICKDGWFYKPYEEWFDEILIPERTMRRKLTRLEQQGLIETKVKKVNDLNTLHLRPNMDKLIELISIILNSDCPNRPLCLNGTENEQENCIKTAPTGHFVRSGTATLSDSSIYTEEILHNTTEPPQKPVVVVTPFQTQKILAIDETQKLTEAFEKTPFESENIKCLDDFLSAALYSILNRDKDIGRGQRLRGILKLVSNGTFEEPKGWAKEHKKGFIKEVKEPTEDEFIRFEKNLPGYEWVGDFIQSMYLLDRLPTQEYYQMKGRTGYKWVNDWMEAKGYNRKQC